MPMPGLPITTVSFIMYFIFMPYAFIVVYLQIPTIHKNIKASQTCIKDLSAS